MSDDMVSVDREKLREYVDGAAPYLGIRARERWMDIHAELLDLTKPPWEPDEEVVEFVARFQNVTRDKARIGLREYHDAGWELRPTR